ncbi:MAG: GNAT family N-acetyltransferase [Lachnospiraceae bacterium]|nr:GNAT family N-acetyltransferase [Lachnospiraceae bacterium]
MIYLQKVIALVEKESCIDSLKMLGQTLLGDGVGFRCFLGEDVMNCRLVIDCSPEAADEYRDDERRLWITDSAGQASNLTRQGEAVLALLHVDNREQDFSGILYACESPEELDAEYMDRVYRRCADIPWDIIETDRCMVRETTEADVEAFFEIYAHSEISHYTEGLYPTVEKEKEYIREYIEKVYGFLGFGVWSILKKDTGEIIGRAGFSYREGYEEPEIGFVIGVPWQGQGYAWEVCSALLTMGEKNFGFTIVNAFVRPENKASVALCKKLGFKELTTVRKGGEKHLYMQRYKG